jgi:hypothetical protein
VLSIGAAIVILAGCGASQPPVGAQGAMRQSSALAPHADRGKSWMRQDARSDDLLYVSSYDKYVNVYSYPKKTRRNSDRFWHSRGRLQRQIQQRVDHQQSERLSLRIHEPVTWPWAPALRFSLSIVTRSDAD